MSNLKKFTDFEKISENNTNPFDEFILGQKVVGMTTHEISYAQASGVLFENGYKFVSYGGGLSGEDINNSYIISPEGEVISTYNN